MKDLSTNHSCIYTDNSSQEQYLRSNTQNNKINRCVITRECQLLYFLIQATFLTYIYSHYIILFLYNFSTDVKKKYYNNTYTAINIISKVITIEKRINQLTHCSNSTTIMSTVQKQSRVRHLRLESTYSNRKCRSSHDLTSLMIVKAN